MCDSSLYFADSVKQNTVLPEAVSYWEEALMVRKTESVIRLSRYNNTRISCLCTVRFPKNIFCLHFRKCRNNQVFLVPNDPHPYCMNACEAATMCGEVQVPEHHLEVIYKN